MKTINSFLKATRILEFLDLASDAMYGDFQAALSRLMPEVRLLPVRSITADVFCVKHRGTDYIVWDESYLGCVIPIAYTLAASNRAALHKQARALGLRVMADLLFDEGLYIDAWLMGTVGHGELQGAAPSEGGFHSSEFAQRTMLAFLFLHEVGHLLKTYKPELYAEVRLDAESRIRRYTQYLSRLNGDERNAALDGTGYIFDLANMPDDGAVALDNDLVEEVVADGFATNQVFRWLTSLGASPVAVSEAILAMRLGMEMIRDVREATRFVAIEKRAMPAQPHAERMRNLVLRHDLLYTAVSFATSLEERGQIDGDIVSRHNELLLSKGMLYGDLASRLIAFGIDEAKTFRLKMGRYQVAFGNVTDENARYMQSYLRLRGWVPNEGGFDEKGLDVLPDLITTTVNMFRDRLQEEFDISPAQDGTSRVFLRPKDTPKNDKTGNS